MFGENLVILIGMVGNDAEYKLLPNGGAVANISLGLDEGYKDKQSGAQVDKTQWQRVVAYKGWADYANKHVKKGTKLYVKGKINNRSWVDPQSGQTRYITEVIAEYIEKLDWQKKTEQQGQPANYHQQGNSGAQQGGKTASYGFQKPQGQYRQQTDNGYSNSSGAEIPEEPLDDIPFALGKRNDCLKLCLVEFFKLDVMSVPNFEIMETNEWRQTLKEWLKTLNYQLNEVYERPTDNVTYLAIGKNKEGILHCVVEKEGVLVWDPDSSQSSLVSISKYWLLTPITN